MSGAVRHNPKGIWYLEEGLKTEIVNQDFSLSNCNITVLPFLLKRECPIGGQIGTNYVICGGKDDDRKISDNCFSVSTSGKLNTTFANLKFPRYGAASVVINKTLYISGGKVLKEDSNFHCNASAEIIAENHENSRFVNNLSQPLSNHCSVLLSNQKIMVIGTVY